MVGDFFSFWLVNFLKLTLTRLFFYQFFFFPPHIHSNSTCKMVKVITYGNGNGATGSHFAGDDLLQKAAVVILNFLTFAVFTLLIWRRTDGQTNGRTGAHTHTHTHSNKQTKNERTNIELHSCPLSTIGSITISEVWTTSRKVRSNFVDALLSVFLVKSIKIQSSEVVTVAFHNCFLASLSSSIWSELIFTKKTAVFATSSLLLQRELSV